jgi:PIN domain nuclease of toxin-antitoxin system
MLQEFAQSYKDWSPGSTSISSLPFDADHALRLYGLPCHHRDPFDRMLIATALAEDIPLIGSDRLFKRYKGLKVIW